MPCGKTRRSQFKSQAAYEAHRTKLMKIILGDDWQDLSVSELIAAHPELRQISLLELLHRAHHIEQARPSSQPGTVKQQPRPTDQRLAIEAPKPQQTAEEWLKSYLNDQAPVD